MRAVRASKLAAINKISGLMSPNQDLQIYQGDIPNISDAYYNKYVKTGPFHADYGELYIASIPLPDHNGDWVSWCVFGNESNVLIPCKSLNLMIDDADYLAHLQTKISKYPKLTELINQFTDNNSKSTKLTANTTKKRTQIENTTNVKRAMSLNKGKRAKQWKKKYKLLKIKHKVHFFGFFFVPFRTLYN